ncbi:MAG TPA: hypothetical protein PKD57_11550 [Saprospiraceae bacterium]|nr:hypothetical protein [Saprospiraceae bacterium]
MVKRFRALRSLNSKVNDQHLQKELQNSPLLSSDLSKRLNISFFRPIISKIARFKEEIEEQFKKK